MSVPPLYPENALILAPLSGFTDLPYRRAARRCGCRFAFTEMVDAASLACSPDRAAVLLRRGEDEEFLGAQIVGADPEFMRRAADEIDRYEFDLVDFNLGCPVPKVTRKGAGAALGRNLELARRDFGILAERCRFPLTVKMRIVDENDPAPSVELARAMVELGARAVTVHGRTLEGFYSGTMHPEIIRAIREALPPEIPVIANGGVRDRATHEALKRESGVSRVMLAQGAMGNPWLFRQLAEGNDAPPTVGEWKALIREHVSGMVALYGEESAMRQARKIVHDYLKGRGLPAAARAEASTLAVFADLDRLLDKLRPAPGAIASRPLAF